MKGLSFNSGLLGMFGVEQAIEILAEHGYQAIDISLEVDPPFLPAPPPHMSPQADANTRRRVRRCAEQAGVEIAALNAHTNPINGAPEVRKANVQFVRESIELAYDLGAKYVVTGAGVKNFYGREAQYWEWLVDGFRELVAEADRLGLTMAVEAGGSPGQLVHNTSRMQKLLSYEGLESLQVLFDPSAYQIRGESAVEAYKALSQRVAHVHAKDGKGNPEDFEFPPLGMGDVDYEGLVDAMIAVGYTGYISVEYEAFAWGYDPDPRKVLTESKAFFDSIFSSRGISFGESRA